VENNLPPPPSPKTPAIPNSYLTYHFAVAWPNFVKSRPTHLAAVYQTFNLGGLILHLFTPYKRMELSGKVSLADKISFNLISRVVGALVRMGLLIAGILVTIFFLFFDFIAIFFYLIIPYSYVNYAQIQNTHITTIDLKSNTAFIKKISSTKLFQTLSTFLDPDFKSLIQSLPDPKTLGVRENQKASEALTIILSSWPALKTYLEQKNIKQENFKLLVEYLDTYLDTPKIAKVQPLGQTLIYGYTNILEKYGTELTNLSHPPTYGRKEMLNKIDKILTRIQNNNVLLVGDPGVGKHSVLESLASAISKSELVNIQDKRLILLDLVALLSSSKNMGEIQGNFEQMLTEAKRAGNIIIAIDQIDRIATQNDGRTDLTQVITTILTDNSLPLIGLTTIDDFNNYIRTNSNLMSLFERVDVDEPKDDELITILVGKSIPFSQKEKVNISLSAILEIIDKSNHLMADKRQPEKSILILEDAIAQAKRNKLTQLTVETVDEILSEKTNTPVGKISQNEAAKLTELETTLHKRIVGQQEAIDEISKAMRRARAELDKSAKPMGSFMFLGPTGVGKTETAKALAESYFGDENRMVRFDMTEFQGEDSLSRLIGNPATKSPGQLATQIREHPFGILLIDEFEKAGRDVQNLFLQILDEGNLTDAFGKKVSFSNIIVIATSNAAAEFIREEVEKSVNLKDIQKTIIKHVLEKGLFSPELVNRFDAVVVYKPLSREEIVQVAYLMLMSFAKNLKETKNITLEITPDLAQLVATKGYVVAFGARPIRRLIQDKIEDEIAKLIIGEKIKNGDTLHTQELEKFLA
jgi:ATP-dependent Clp protease ATP-binding subunit ClpC